MVLLCLTIEMDITRFATHLQLHFFAVVILSCFNQSLLQIFPHKNRSFSHYQGGAGALSILEHENKLIQKISFSSLLIKKNGDKGYPYQTVASRD